MDKILIVITILITGVAIYTFKDTNFKQAFVNLYQARGVGNVDIVHEKTAFNELLKKYDRSWEFWEQIGYAAIACVVSMTIGWRIHSFYYLLDRGDKKNGSQCGDANIERKVDQLEGYFADYYLELQQKIQLLEEKYSSMTLKMLSILEQGDFDVDEKELAEKTDSPQQIKNTLITDCKPLDKFNGNENSTLEDIQDSSKDKPTPEEPKIQILISEEKPEVYSSSVFISEVIPANPTTATALDNSSWNINQYMEELDSVTLSPLSVAQVSSDYEICGESLNNGSYIQSHGYSLTALEDDLQSSDINHTEDHFEKNEHQANESCNDIFTNDSIFQEHGFYFRPVESHLPTLVPNDRIGISDKKDKFKTMNSTKQHFTVLGPVETYQVAKGSGEAQDTSACRSNLNSPPSIGINQSCHKKAGYAVQGNVTIDDKLNSFGSPNNLAEAPSSQLSSLNSSPRKQNEIVEQVGTTNKNNRRQKQRNYYVNRK